MVTECDGLAYPPSTSREALVAEPITAEPKAPRGRADRLRCLPFYGEDASGVRGLPRQADIFSSTARSTLSKSA